VAFSFGLGWIGSPRRRIAATMHAAISRAPFSRCLSMPESIGEHKAKVNQVGAISPEIKYCSVLTFVRG